MALDWIAKWQREGEEMGLAKFDDLERRSESIEARSHALRSTRSELEKIDFHSLEYGCALINRIREWGRIITDMILLRVEGEFQLASFMVHRKIPPEVGGRICKKNDRVKALCRTMRRGSIEFCQIALAQYFADLDEDVFSWDEFGLGEESQDAA